MPRDRIERPAILLVLALGTACRPVEPPPRELVREIRLGGTLTLAERPFRIGGFPSNEACVAGDYTHSYTITSGIRAGEVWLCCVPIAELLRESFSCADGVVLVGTFNGGSADDLKVQYCALYDAESTERVFVPACLPAPERAPTLDDF